MKFNKKRIILLIATIIMIITPLSVAAIGKTFLEKNVDKELTNTKVDNLVHKKEKQSETKVEVSKEEPKKYVIKEIVEKEEAKEEIKEDNEELKKSIYFEGKALVNISEGLTLNLRQEPNKDSKIVALMESNEVVDIVEVFPEWLKVTSGEFEGYINREYVLMGEVAEEKALNLGYFIATTDAESLRIRADKTTESDIILEITNEDILRVLELNSDEWVKVIFDQSEGYVAKDYINISIDTQNQYNSQWKNKIIDTESEIYEEAQTLEVIQTKSEPVTANYDESYLLAALVSVEAGPHDYEGQLAVANVILNRYKYGYASSIKNVIYEPGQFPPAYNGILDSRLANGPYPQAIEATNAALAGNNNIGDLTSFDTYIGQNPSQYSKSTIIGGQIFYSY